MAEPGFKSKQSESKAHTLFLTLYCPPLRPNITCILYFTFISPGSTSNMNHPTFLQTDTKEEKKGLPEFPTAPLFTREFGATVRGQCPSWEELGIATGLAAGCAKMMLGSFRPILLGALPGAEWITGPWIGQDGAAIWRGCIGNNPILCMGEYWAGGDWGKLYIGIWTWCGGWAPCWGGPSLVWDPGWDVGWVMAADWEEFCGNGWGWGE